MTLNQTDYNKPYTVHTKIRLEMWSYISELFKPPVKKKTEDFWLFIKNVRCTPTNWFLGAKCFHKQHAL